MKLLRGLYLCSYKAIHSNYYIDYNDIIPLSHIKYVCSCLDVPLDDYDYILCSPPCNYWSRANYRRDLSEYSLNTKDLLPKMIIKLAEYGKPFIIENVRNKSLFKLNGIYELADKYNLFVYEIGRHTYFTNVFVNLNCPQKYDFKLVECSNGVKHTYRLSNNVQGSENVFNCFEIFLDYVNKYYFDIQ